MNDIQALQIIAPALQRATWTLSFESGDASLEVRRFSTEESLNHLFSLTITAVSLNPDLDLAAFVGRGAAFSAATGVANALVGQRAWSGVCRSMDLVRVETTGLSTYELIVVPRLWQLTQRRNHRLFQHISIPDIVNTLLGEWSIEPDWHIAQDDYPKLELRVQYGESDYDFFCRLLEEAGITFSLVDSDGDTRLVLDDQPHSGALRATALPFRDSPGQAQAARLEYVTAVRLHEEVKPTRHIVRDFDYRRPRFRLEGSSDAQGAAHALMEQYHYLPGAALAEVGEAAGTPSADDKGMARHSDKVGQALADRSLQASRGPRRVVRLVTSAIDLAPGVIFSLADHPRGELGPGQRLLVTRVELEGAEGEEWKMRVKAVFAVEPFLPSQVTPKPHIHGVQSALVVGPDGQEIYTDEFGRVRVQFHWDREGDNNDDSSVWMRVVYNASGPGYGIVSIPRVGHEVIIAFMEGDPDLPMVVGSTYNATSPVPYDLPDNKTVSTWKAASSPGGEGFNEIKMENKAGEELLYQQAEKDHAVLVKNDEVHLVGHDRSVIVEHDEVKSVKNDRTHVVQHDERTSILNDRVEQVGHDEHVGVGNDRAHQIKMNDTLGVGESYVVQVGKSAVLAVGENRSVHVGKDEQISIGQDQSVSVGQSRSTSVGINDSIQVGSRYTVTVSNGLKGKLASVLGGVLDGSVLSSLSKVVGPFATGPVQHALGKLAKTSMGATPLSALIQGPAAALQEVLPGPLKGIASMVSGQIDSLLGDLFGVSGGPPTTFDMVDKKITFTTGDASIVLDGGKIILQAKEGIFITSKEVGVQAEVKIEIVAGMHPVQLAAATAAGKEPPPEAMKGSLLLSGMMELAAISPKGQTFIGAKKALLVGCEAKTEIVGKKGALLASTEGDSVVKGKTVQLNPPDAKQSEPGEEAPKPNESATPPADAASASTSSYAVPEGEGPGEPTVLEPKTASADSGEAGGFGGVAEGLSASAGQPDGRRMPTEGMTPIRQKDLSAAEDSAIFGNRYNGYHKGQGSTVGLYRAPDGRVVANTLTEGGNVVKREVFSTGGTREMALIEYKGAAQQRFFAASGPTYDRFDDGRTRYGMDTVWKYRDTFRGAQMITRVDDAPTGALYGPKTGVEMMQGDFIVQRSDSPSFVGRVRGQTLTAVGNDGSWKFAVDGSHSDYANPSALDYRWYVQNNLDKLGLPTLDARDPSAVVTPDQVTKAIQFASGAQLGVFPAYQAVLIQRLRAGGISQATYDQLTSDSNDAVRYGKHAGFVAAAAVAWAEIGALKVAGFTADRFMAALAAAGFIHNTELAPR